MGQNNSSPENSSQDAPPPAQTRIPPPPRSVENVYYEAIRSEDGPKEPREIQKLERCRITGLPENSQDYAYEHFREGLTLRPQPGLVISRGTTLGALSGMRRLSMLIARFVARVTR